MIKPRFEYKDCLLFLSIATIPLQTLAIPARSTLVDISCILVATYFILYLPKKSLLKLVYLFIGFSLLSILSGVLWELSYPIARIVAPAAFYSMMACLLVSHNTRLVIKTNVINSAIYTSIIISIISTIAFKLNSLSRFGLGGVFSESSYASLYYSASIGYLLTLIFFKLGTENGWKILRLFFSVIMLIYALVSFPGIHPASLAISLSILYLESIYRRTVLFITRLRSKKVNLVLAMTIIIMTISFINDENNILMSRITSRLAGFTSGDNLSSLVYSAGFFQFANSIQLCPIIGCGSGSPGYLGLDIYGYLTKLTSVPYYIQLASSLNKHDLYSLFFRAIVELGPILGGILLLGTFMRFYNAFKLLLKGLMRQVSTMYAKSHSHDYEGIKLLAILTWFFIFYIGSLLKEPHLFRSITFTPIMLGLLISRQILNPPALYEPKANQIDKHNQV